MISCYCIYFVPLVYGGIALAFSRLTSILCLGCFLISQNCASLVLFFSPEVLTRNWQVKTRTSDISVESELDHNSDFIPIVRSGAWKDIGFRPSMEDVYICIDDFGSDCGLGNVVNGPNAFYGVIFFS